MCATVSEAEGDWIRSSDDVGGATDSRTVLTESVHGGSSTGRVLRCELPAIPSDAAGHEVTQAVLVGLGSVRLLALLYAAAVRRLPAVSHKKDYANYDRHHDQAAHTKDGYVPRSKSAHVGEDTGHCPAGEVSASPNPTP